MSKLAPNKQCEILINDFISLAKVHLTTLQGQAITTSTNTAGAVVPSVALWKGYNCNPEEPDAPSALPEIVPTQFSSELELTIVELELLKAGVPQVYGTSYSSEVTSAPIHQGNAPTTRTNAAARTNFVASGVDARRVSETYLGRPLSDEEWNTFIALIFAESGRDQREEAHVAATILNRLRFKFTPAGIANSRYKFDTIMDIAWQWRQYEAVTGNPSNGNKPSRWFLEGPAKYRNVELGIYGSIVNLLPGISIYLTDFTSNNDCLYVKCKPGGKGLADVIYPLEPIRGRDYSILTSRRNPPYNGEVIGSTIFSISRIIINARNRGIIK
jgi:hypothetical protein